MFSQPAGTAASFVAHHRPSDNTWQSLEDHLLGVGEIAAQLAGKLGLQEMGELLGLLHDLGKYSRAFQAYLKSAIGALNQDEDEDWVDAKNLKGKVDHSTAGAQFAWQVLGKTGALETAQALALCIASHHSGLIDCISARADAFGTNLFARRMEKAQQRTHLDEVQRLADPELLQRCRGLLADGRVAAKFQALLTQIGRSNQAQGSPVTVQQQWGLLVRFLFSCLIDADRIDTADFEKRRQRSFRPGGRYTDWTVLVERLERHLAQLPPTRPIDHLRQDISWHCHQAAARPHGIYTLTVPTGGGKTLASLRFALHHARERGLDRIIYVIPFTSIIDQNARVVREVLEPADAPQDQGRIVLEHHGSLTPEQQTWREKVLCENWDAPVVYTTMVQLLEALFGAGTRGARRMHQLVRAVLVFDEVQTLPVQCVHLFNNAINFLATQCNTTALLCTATQPLLDSVNPALGAIRLATAPELIPDVGHLFKALKRVAVNDQRRAGGWSGQEVADLAMAETQASGSCLVIVNTKASARRIFELCAAAVDPDTAFHLSTDMCPAHRKARLAELLARLRAGQPTLCVSTQLIEAGVDVDFGSVIRFMAGLDSIAQAAGRCNRNGLRTIGRVHVVNPQAENLDKLPDILQGRNAALRVLDEFQQNPERFSDDLLSPAAMHAYYRYYFFDRAADMSYAVVAGDVAQNDTLLNLLSLNAGSVNEYKRQHASAPPLFFRQAFMTAAKAFRAIDSATQAVIVPFGADGKQLIADLCAAYDVELEIELLRRAQQYSVNVFPHVLKKLMAAQALHEVKPDTRILCLNERYYSDLFGLATEPVSPMEVLYA
ncbi:CRISPR-associated endonuclease Cas3'' [Comamonas sp. NLF-1-9]|uniref:CRISPR-associated endonuclease Cas3'' n=1 Tax=Comamonas sp. NLF-1-9 TaxID=2853163 RepID=UPI001C47B529|nr:CRISPR-associated endonuclease Cas3'' [Comamonas sp. NLF-1-9]QXL83986.1 CRISPR-associated endonuclease Cas3'' [Comamonas sp. NLF-1-9]